MPDPDGTETCGLVPGIPHCRHPDGYGCQKAPGSPVVPHQDRPRFQIYRHRHRPE